MPLDLVKFIVWAIPVLFAITLHEVAHGWVAYRCGDTTAQRMGRLTLNPLKHIDPFGTVILPSLLFLTGGVVFGWAKPVPVNDNNLQHRRRDMALVALAGPCANFVMAIAWGLLGKWASSIPSDFTATLTTMCIAGIWINIILMVLNLLPIPPLDGSQFLNQCLPKKTRQHYESLLPYGMVFICVLAITGLLGKIIIPTASIIMRFIIELFEM